MRVETKTTIIIIAVLLIGIIIGFFGSGTYLRFQHHRRFERIREEGGLVALMGHIIQPDPDQEEEIYQILLDNTKKVREISEQHHLMLLKNLDSLKTELSPLLNPDQLERFNRFIEGAKKRRPFEGPFEEGPPPFEKSLPHFPGKRPPFLRKHPPFPEELPHLEKKEIKENAQ